MRKRIYEIIEASDGNDVASSLYDAFMMLIIISLLPLNFKEETAFFLVTDKITAFIFIIDYILRWATADFGSSKRRAVAMSSSFFGIAVVALPAGIITAGYMSELRKDKDQFE